MVLSRTKQWKLSHEPGKVKPIYSTIYLLWVNRRGGVRRQWLFSMGGLYVCFWLCKLSPERTEFFGQPVKCAMNTSVCLSLRGSDISMSLRLSFYESPRLVVRFLDTQLRGQEGGGVRLSLNYNVLHLLGTREIHVCQNSEERVWINTVERVGWNESHSVHRSN